MLNTNVGKNVENDQNMLEYVGICWNMLENVGICWNTLEYAGI